MKLLNIKYILCAVTIPMYTASSDFSSLLLQLHSSLDSLIQKRPLPPAPAPKPTPPQPPAPPPPVPQPTPVAKPPVVTGKPGTTTPQPTLSIPRKETLSGLSRNDLEKLDPAVFSNRNFSLEHVDALLKNLHVSALNLKQLEQLSKNENIFMMGLASFKYSKPIDDLIEQRKKIERPGESPEKKPQQVQRNYGTMSSEEVEKLTQNELRRLDRKDSEKLLKNPKVLVLTDEQFKALTAETKFNPNEIIALNVKRAMDRRRLSIDDDENDDENDDKNGWGDVD